MAAHYDTSRCQNLPCDTTKQAVRMLNDWKGGTQPAAWAADADCATCYSCHTTLYHDVPRRARATAATRFVSRPAS